MQVVHDDEDLPERAGPLGGPRLAGRREAADERDLAGRAPQVLRLRVAHVHHFALERVDRRRERVRESGDGGAVGQRHATVLRQADVRLDLATLDLHAVGLERALDVVERPGLAGAARLALPGPDRADVLHQRRRRHLGGQQGLQRIAIFPGRRHEITSSWRCRIIREILPAGQACRAGLPTK